MNDRTYGRRFHLSFLVVGLLVSLNVSRQAVAIVIRSDVADAQYTALSAQPEYDSGVAVFSFHTPNPSNSIWCSGTLIHPEWVITAAHCTVESADWSAIVYQGPDRSNPTAEFPVDTRLRNAAFDINNAALGNDFGLLHLTTPVLDVTPARIYRSSGELGSAATVLGYGRTGTGSTGENAALPNGIRRAMQNTVDAFGNVAGWSTKLMLVDFDNPTNGADNVIGLPAPLGLEGAVALNDSGGGWYQQIDGVRYLTGVTSFRASNDGSANSDYGDLSVAGRVSQDLTWIDTRYDRTLFWNGSTGNWHQTTSWYGGIEPAAASAAIVEAGTVTVVNAGETAEYLFIQGTGGVVLNQNLQSSYLRMRDTGRLAVGSPTGPALVTGDLQQEGGEIQIDIGGTAAGQFDQLQVGGNAAIHGSIDVQELASYLGPVSRGASDSFFILAAPSLDWAPQSVEYEDIAISDASTYVGVANSGADGLFARYELTGTGVELETYLALPGDANGDGSVDGSDFGIWNANKFTSGQNWHTGDFTGDGVVDGSDFGVWNANKFTSTMLSAVPEPTGILGALVVLLALRPLTRTR